MTDGGEGLIGQVYSIEYRKKISDSLKGKTNQHWKGKKHSIESKIKMSISQTGIKLSEEHKEKLRKPKQKKFKS